jgi:hypothetical protein
MTMSMPEQNEYVNHVGSIKKMSTNMASLELYIRKSIVCFQLEAVQVLPKSSYDVCFVIAECPSFNVRFA